MSVVTNILTDKYNKNTRGTTFMNPKGQTRLPISQQSATTVSQHSAGTISPLHRACGGRLVAMLPASHLTSEPPVAFLLSTIIRRDWVAMHI